MVWRWFPWLPPACYTIKHLACLVGHEWLHRNGLLTCTSQSTAALENANEYLSGTITSEIVHQNVILYLYYWPEVRSSLLLLWCWVFPKIMAINTYSSPVSAWYRLLCELKLWFTIVLYFSIQWQIDDRNSTQKLLNLWDGILCISWHTWFETD